MAPPVRPFVAAIAALAILALAAPGCLAQAGAIVVYRCPGAVYQQAPCAGGRALQVDPSTNALAAPSAADRALAAQWDARADGPWVATLPMPPRMIATPPDRPVPYGLGGHPVAPWFGWAAPRLERAAPPAAGPAPVPARPSRSAR